MEIEPTKDTNEQGTAEVIAAVNKQVKPFAAFMTKFNNDWSLVLSGALAYSLLMAMFPLALALLSILGLALGTLDPNAQSTLITHLQAIFPKVISSGDVIKTIINQLAKVSGVLGVIAVILAIFSGSRLFLVIERCFNIIYRLHARKVLQQNIMAIGMVLIFIVLTPIMMLASSLPAIISFIIKNTSVNQIPGSGYLYSLLAILGSLLVAFILFQAIYMVVPNQHIRFSKSWLGSLVAAVALQIYLTLFPLYATRFLGGYLGQVGFAIILLVFFYYFGVILLLGAEVNAFFSEHVQSRTDDLTDLVYAASGKKSSDKEESSSGIKKDLGLDKIM